ncbi:septal ring lytic transglycosylase RlpA family protein [Ahrensia sp. 13_GOM-1096m]|uniref:septal ring lytic transglycosylase RlpA family protein n=1 Tax=Ahrensia sp. 13_GOM-1096m TaxID=1380380 RepID=UPI00047B3E07|nr:septal ring lytic transglycosylase RlpA family protein [Ahrensia sp. 13_GOM-1096m]
MYKIFSLASAGAVIALTISTTVFTNKQAEASAAQCGKASWYALHSRTASGEMMNPAKLTAAHKTLPFGTKLKVTNRNNGKSVIVRINDRGPFIKGRIVDLSKAAASQIGMIKNGHAPICFQRIS